MAEMQTDDGHSKLEVSMKRTLKAFKVDSDAFTKLLFCRVSVHRRTEYDKRVDLILNGNYNGQSGW